MHSKDRRLGMHRRITRRDFVHGSAVGALGLALPLPTLSMPGAADYPPVRTGLRGSHPGSFEVAHALAREGKQFGSPAGAAEEHDLVVVGGGISGLAAAWFFRKQHGPGARILILDTHDDFGGHAKRNEFHQGGPMRLAWGGTVNMEYPLFSDTVNGLMTELGIDIPRLLEGFHFHWGDEQGALQPAVFFDEANYGRNVLLRGLRLARERPELIAARIPEIPIPAPARESLHRFLMARTDVLAGRSEAEREAYLRRTRYRDFLREHFALPDAAIALFSS
ncbi:MAG: NAD(P)-binding protein, partial [Gammaproteobacteria bacterium]